MALDSFKRLFYKLILTALFLTLTWVTVLGIAVEDTLSMEQQVRCGFTEHTHTDKCYLNGLLLCKQKAHTHSENCYLVLLQDNDINRLLHTVEHSADKSLEGVLNSAMGQALVLNEELAQEPTPLVLSSQDIGTLNDTIEDNGIQPAVVLNENLGADNYLTYSPDLSPLAVGDQADSSNRAVNFYVMLDGKITLIGSDVLENANPDYYSYANTVAMYTDQLETSLTTNNINSTYYFRYNRNGSVDATSDFGSDATYGSNNVRFGNYSDARYVLLCTRQRNFFTYTYTAVPFYTVTLDYRNTGTDTATQRVYVQSGRSSGLALTDEFWWYDENGTLVSELPDAITETTTLYAHSKSYTVNFEDADGNEVASPQDGMPENGLLTVTLPTVAGKENWYWVDKSSGGEVYYRTGETVQVAGSTVFVLTPESFTVTLVYDTGQVRSRTVGYRETFVFDTLPDGWMWSDEGGIRYLSGEQSPPIMQNITYRATSREVAVYYNVNFPAGAVNVVDEVPTIAGTTAGTLTDTAKGGVPLIIRDLTSRTARRQISNSNLESVTYYFKGWQVVGTDVMLLPDASISWKELSGYIAENGTVSLQGVWDEGGRYNSASFFVRFDSAAVDTGGNITSQPSENYTPELFNTHVGGIDTSLSDQEIREKYEIADETSENSYIGDQAIRAMYGEKATGAWFYDFPSDEYVFSYLKEYLANNPGKSLTYEGKAVDPAQLNHDYYEIRWYVFKLEGSSWHVDGKVLKKEGVVAVEKVFGGDDTVLQAEKDGFYILAENGTLDENGEFVPYPHNGDLFKEYLLVVNDKGAAALRNQYPDAEILVFTSEGENHHRYRWVIEGVELGEFWHIEEFPVEIPGYSCYAEYTAYDTDGHHTAIAEYGTRAKVIGKTFALDEDPDQGLMVDFHNYYYPVETIVIKKEDGKTGRPIGGAAFELWQNGQRMTFNYNETTGQYERDEGDRGAVTRITTSLDGYSVIATTGFSYEYGDVEIKEVVSPAGYDPAPVITIGKDVNGHILIKDIEGKSAEQWSDIAEVPNDDVLVVKDYAAEYISVTVEKVWNTGSPADSVVMVLQANGQNAAALFPGMANVQTTLSGANAWKYTWTNLPRYANGEMVTWGVKEIVIGGKPTLADGVTFANWTVTYAPGVAADTDGDGDVDNWKFTVINAQKRIQMILTKVGTDGKILPGSVFTLEQVELVNGVWKPVTGTLVNTQTTDSNGMLTFDNLTADVYYRLTEIKASDGYYVTVPPTVLTMDADGNIKRVLDDGTLAQLYDPVIEVTGPFNIRVTNLQMTALPETGGSGTNRYIQSGGMLMLLSALALWIYKNNRRKEGTDTS
ncbi:MAG: Cna B-type domain-containing protein [Clostridia bacterium]|nr:Cna B-type domain-containing protein [Clostridia bacterium]